MVSILLKSGLLAAAIFVAYRSGHAFGHRRGKEGHPLTLDHYFPSWRGDNTNANETSPGDDPFSAPNDDPFGTPNDDPFGTPSDDPFGTPNGDPFGGAN